MWVTVNLRNLALINKEINMAKKDIDMENYPFRTFSDEDMQKIKKWERENWIQSAYARKEAFSVTQYYQEVLEEIEYEEHEKMLNVNKEMEERIDSGEIFGKSEKERKVDFATNEIIEKIRAAGIEVVTDKDEFDRILESEAILQKMSNDDIIRNLAKERDDAIEKKNNINAEKLESFKHDVNNHSSLIKELIKAGNTLLENGFDLSHFSADGFTHKFGFNFSSGKITGVGRSLGDDGTKYYIYSDGEKISIGPYTFNYDWKYDSEPKRWLEGLQSFKTQLSEIYGLNFDNVEMEEVQKNEDIELNEEAIKENVNISQYQKKLLSNALKETAEDFVSVVYSRENYNKIFGDGVIESPVETIKFGSNQFIKLSPGNRNNFMYAIRQTLEKPSIILGKETWDDNSESFKPVHLYGKSFINDNNSEKVVESLIIFKEGNNIAVSLHPKGIDKFIEQIKTTNDIVYLDDEVSRVVAFAITGGDSHVVKENENFLSRVRKVSYSSLGQESYPLINKNYNRENLLSSREFISTKSIEIGKLEITKDNFDRYFNILNQHDAFKDKRNRIASELFNFHVSAENKENMKNWLEEQGYIITGKEVIQYMTNDNGLTYGFVHNGKIYLNPDLMNSNAAVHEYTHLWDAYTQKTNPELWNKGMNLFKNTKYWNEVISDPNYQDIKSDDNLVLSEIHSRICGDIAEKVLNRIAELDGEQVKLDAIDWNKETAGYVLELIKDLNPENSFIQQMKEENIKEDVLAFFNTPMKDLIQEKNILISNEVSWTPLHNGRDTDYTSFNGHTVERYFAGINKNNENTYSVKIDGVPLTFIDEETNEENELYFSEKELDKQILNDTLYYGNSMDEINFDSNNITSSIISEPSISYMPKKDPAVTRDIINQAKARRASYCHSVVKGEKKGLWKSFNEFQRHGVFDIQGQTLMTDKNGHLTDTGFKQLAISMDIYRDKRFESARYVFVDKDGTIKDQMALSTFMPNHSISKLDETFKQVLEHAEKTNTKIAFVHNHPSGNIEASYDDIQFTKELESYLNQDNKDLFLGHVILDHDTFNCYSPESKWNSVTFEHPGKDRFEKEVPDFAKTVIDGDKKLREIAQSINSTNEYNKDWIPVIFARENASVGGVEYFNKDFFIENDSNVIKNEFEKIGLLCGSDRAIPVVPNGMSYEPELHSEMINKFREGCFYDMALGNRTTTDLHLTKYSNEIFNYTQKEMEEMTKIESTFEPVKVSKKEVGVSSKVAENKTYYVRENIQPVNVKTLLEKHEDIPIFDHKYFVDQKFLPAFTFANNDVYVRCNAKNLAINSELKLNPEKKVDLILSKKQFAQIIATEKLKEKVARMHDFEVNNKAITPIVVAPNNMTALQQDLIFHQNNHLNYTERKEAFSSMYKEIMDNVKQIETKTLSTNQKTILDINQEFNKMQKPNSINSVQKTPGQEYDNSVDFGI